MNEPSKADAALAAALVKARDLTRSVQKDGYNKHGKYNYASADGIVQTARAALAEVGVNVIPTMSRLEMVGKELVLNRAFRVVHELGGYIEGQTSWPVVIRGGDGGKGAAAAETTSYAYYLKTLLDMPRGEKDDINHDSHEPATAPAPPVQMLGAGASKLLQRIDAATGIDALTAARDYVREKSAALTTYEFEKLIDRITQRESEFFGGAL